MKKVKKKRNPIWMMITRNFCFQEIYEKWKFTRNFPFQEIYEKFLFPGNFFKSRVCVGIGDL